ncbi:MAG TPA: LamG-like jellyroll fold domain-containing protein [Verrucomicrobiales bacterium]|jgi:MYXO-CTERM domain-containing protein|nr:LamG-like jellyroll fold domain-containing protein [Verrucomicrobiales bacterium]
MKAIRRTLAVLPFLALSNTSSPAATLVGQWTFENGSLQDSTGNFGNLVLQGNASIINGALDLNGSATTSSGWASTPGGPGSPYNAGPGGGLAISSKTMVSWVTMQGLSPVAQAGSAMTLDSVSVDNFDGIVFSETPRSATNGWMSGSSFWNRSAPGQFNQSSAVETTTGNLIQLAITYEVAGANVTITGYRNGVLMGTYVSGSAGTWAAGDQEVIFGQRHIGPPGAFGVQGGIDALIHEARLYDGALTLGEINSLTMVPEPGSAALALTAAGLLCTRRRSRSRGC